MDNGHCSVEAGNCRHKGWMEVVASLWLPHERTPGCCGPSLLCCQSSPTKLWTHRGWNVLSLFLALAAVTRAALNRSNCAIRHKAGLWTTHHGCMRMGGRAGSRVSVWHRVVRPWWWNKKKKNSSYCHHVYHNDDQRFLSFPSLLSGSERSFGISHRANDVKRKKRQGQ